MLRNMFYTFSDTIQLIGINTRDDASCHMNATLNNSISHSSNIYLCRQYVFKYLMSVGISLNVYLVVCWSYTNIFGLDPFWVMGLLVVLR